MRRRGFLTALLGLALAGKLLHLRCLYHITGPGGYGGETYCVLKEENTTITIDRPYDAQFKEVLNG